MSTFERGDKVVSERYGNGKVKAVWRNSREDCAYVKFVDGHAWVDADTLTLRVPKSDRAFFEVGDEVWVKGTVCEVDGKDLFVDLLKGERYCTAPVGSVRFTED